MKYYVKPIIQKLLAKREHVASTLHNQYDSWWFNSPAKMQNSWIEQFCIHHSVPASQWISVFGERSNIKLSSEKRKVFFTPENLSDRFREFGDHLLDQVDCAIGFENLNHPKYIRFPLWLMYFTQPNSENPGEDFRQRFSRTWSVDRPIFCSQIASHDERGNGKGLRTMCSSTLDKIEPVFNEGRLLNNSSLLKNTYHNDPSFYLRDCRFNICLENSAGSGYITEKIFRPLQTGAIPIYWGDSAPEPDVINPGSYLLLDPKNPDDIYKEVRKLEKNARLRHSIINNPKITKQTSDWINNKHEMLVKLLKS